MTVVNVAEKDRRHKAAKAILRLKFFMLIT